jgi:hypothetical protein
MTELREIDGEVYKVEREGNGKLILTPFTKSQVFPGLQQSYAISEGSAPFFNVDIADIRTFEDAEGLQNFLDVFIRLRQCEGVAKAVDGKHQFQIRFSPKADINLEVLTLRFLSHKLGRLSPCFYSEELARQAIEIVGEGNITRALIYSQRGA